MPKNLEMLCESCSYGDIKKVEGLTRSLNPHKFIRLQVWCELHNHVVGKWKTWKDAKECGYRPKAGRIGKKLYQKQLGE